MVTVSYLFHHDSLLQNGKDLITKCDSYIIKILGIQLPYIFQVQSQSIQTIANILYIYIYNIYIYVYINIYIYIYIKKLDSQYFGVSLLSTAFNHLIPDTINSMVG